LPATSAVNSYQLPMGLSSMEIGQRLGLALLLALTFFAFYNDINRLFTG